MKLEPPLSKEERFRLLNIQVAPFRNGVVIRRGAKRVFVEGDGVKESLEYLIDNARGSSGVTIEELVQQAPPKIQATLTKLAAVLQDRRMIIKIPAGAEPEPADSTDLEEVFYWTFGTTPGRVAASLAEKTVTIIGANTLGAALVSMLKSCRFQKIEWVDHILFRNRCLFDQNEKFTGAAGQSEPISFESWSDPNIMPDCLVVVSDFGGLSMMREWNEFCVTHNVPFLPVVMQDMSVFLGPMTVPGQTPCFECYWRRQNSNLDEPELARATEAGAFLAQGGSGFLPPMVHIAAGLASMELLRYLSQELPVGNIGRVVEMDLMEPALTRRKLLRLPRCPVCSGRARQATPAADIMVFMPSNT
jgi:bacteriocin biosynthesis cyclodehydratase domain-containing protein